MRNLRGFFMGGGILYSCAIYYWKPKYLDIISIILSLFQEDMSRIITGYYGYSNKLNIVT